MLHLRKGVSDSRLPVGVLRQGNIWNAVLVLVEIVGMWPGHFGVILKSLPQKKVSFQSNSRGSWAELGRVLAGFHSLTHAGGLDPRAGGFFLPQNGLSWA